MSTHTWIFYRGDYFYPIEVPFGSDVLSRVRLNPGTTKVEDANDGFKIIWEAPTAPR